MRVCVCIHQSWITQNCVFKAITIPAFKNEDAGCKRKVSGEDKHAARTEQRTRQLTCQDPSVKLAEEQFELIN